MDKIEVYKEIERRGLLGQLPQEKQDAWAEYKRRQEPQEEKPLQDVIGGLANLDRGATAGFGKKVGGLINAIGALPVDAVMSDKNIYDSFRDRYNEIVKPATEAQEQFSEEHPIASSALQLSGAVASPINKVGAGLLAKPTSFIGKLGTGVGVGAGTGAVYGLGGAESLEEIPSKIADESSTGAVVGGAFPVAGKALQLTGKGIGKVAPLILGKTSGAGDEAISAAYQAGKTGNVGFLEKMRKPLSADEILDKADENISNIRKARGQKYSQDMQKLFEESEGQQLDLMPFAENIRNIARSEAGGATYLVDKETASVLREAQDLGKKFAKDADRHNVQGFDNLKKAIANIKADPNTRAEAVRTQLKNSVENEIKKQNPKYADIMRQYGKDSDEIATLEKAFSLSRNASPETTIRKLQSVIRNNANTDYGYRQQLLEKLDKGGEITESVLGNALHSYEPKGLIGTASGLGGLATLNLPLVASSSPRLIGEGAYKLGQMANKMPKDVKINPTAIWLSLLGDK